MNIPAAYDLKRVFPYNRAHFNYFSDLDGLMTASVYNFPDQEAFDSDAVWSLCRDFVEHRPHLPHERVIFEVRDRSGKCQSLLVYCQNCEDGVEATLLLKSTEKKGWSPPITRVLLRGGGKLEVSAHPSACHDEKAAQVYAEITLGVLGRALTILAQSPEVSHERMPLARCRSFEKAGVSGWIWHTVKINPAKLRARGPDLGGTHATPRWHIRRGHWRTIGDGRRVFVRECEVGDKTRGGVVKDYEVAA